MWDDIKTNDEVLLSTWWRLYHKNSSFFMKWILSSARLTEKSFTQKVQFEFETQKNNRILLHTFHILSFVHNIRSILRETAVKNDVFLCWSQLIEALFFFNTELMVVCTVNECPNITTVVLALSNSTWSNGAYKKYIITPRYSFQMRTCASLDNTIIGNRSK